MMPLAQTSPRAVDVGIEALERMTLDRLRPGDVLPSEGQLAQTLSVSRLTIREAVRVLEARGLLDLRKGRRPGVRAQNGDLPRELFRIAVRSWTPPCTATRRLRRPRGAGIYVRRSTTWGPVWIGVRPGDADDGD